MYKLYTASLLFFLLFHFSGFSQNTIKGSVKDSLEYPLPYANVIAQPQDSSKAVKFAITGEEGQYFLKLENIPYTVTTTYMGYEPFSFEILLTKDSVKDIYLKQQAEGLEEVVIELPVIVKEDTIIYNVDKLITGEERKLKDVLRNLPGIEVSRDGTITVQGKKVTTLLVENKKFFGGGSKLAIDNIPANVIDQIEVLDNYNEVAFLKNLENSDEMAMNIKLKENKRNFVFGDIEAGKGNNEFYKTHSNLFYYSPKTTVNTIANLNNSREQVFTYQQYFDFQGGMNQIFNKGSTILDTPSDYLQFIEREDVIQSERKFGALNFTQEVNNKLNLSGFGIFSNTKEDSFSQFNNQYNNFTEIKDLYSGINNELSIGNIKAVYLPNLTDQWYFKSLFKKIDKEYNNKINSFVNTTTNHFLTNENVAESYFNQTIEWHRKMSKKHTFSFATNYTFEERTPKKLWTTSDSILQGFISIIEESNYRINQLKRIKNNQIETIIKHYWVINRDNHIYSTIGNTYLNQRFFTRDFQQLDDGEINDFDSENFGNDLNFSLNDLYFGFHYKLQLGILTFNQGAFLHHYKWNIKQQYNITKTKTVILPNISAKAKFSRSKELEFDYELKTSFSDASQFANNYYLQSYNSVYLGNENLENGLSHNFKLRYTKFSTYRGIRLYATVNYIDQIKGVKNAVTFQGINQGVMPIMLDNPEKSWSFYGNIRKSIKDFNFSLGLRYNASKYLQQVNQDFVTNKNINISYDIAVKTLFDNLPIIEFGFKQKLGYYILSEYKSEFLTNEPYLNIDYDFLKGFIASFDFTSFKYKNKSLNLKNNYEIANSSLYYNKENSAWGFEIEAQNLFDVKFKNQNSFSSYIISDTRTYILPRIIMLSISYNL